MDLHLAAGWDRIKKTKKERKILNARNYQKELEKLIDQIQKENKVPRLFLHSCCAALQQLCAGISVEIF